MCNLNIVVRKSDAPKKIVETVPAFMMAVGSTSYLSNDDGDGIFCDGLLWKGKDKIDLFRIADHIRNSRIIITHQRIATSGFSAKFTQPFASKDFVLAHNGIISSFATAGKSDTYMFFKKFCLEFAKEFEGKAEDKREECIMTVVKSLLGDTFGSYSIALFDKVTQRLYYFKNMGASINAYQSKNILYLTTSMQNKQFLSMFRGEEFFELGVVGYTIYRIGDNDLQMYEIGSIDVPAYQKDESFAGLQKYYNYSEGSWGYDYDKRKMDKVIADTEIIPDDYFLDKARVEAKKEDSWNRKPRYMFDY